MEWRDSCSSTGMRCDRSRRGGREIGNLDLARAKAVKAARGVMAGEVLAGKLCLSCCIVIEDGRGREMIRVPFKEALTLSRC